MRMFTDSDSICCQDLENSLSFLNCNDIFRGIGGTTKTMSPLAFSTVMLAFTHLFLSNYPQDPYLVILNSTDSLQNSNLKYKTKTNYARF